MLYQGKYEVLPLYLAHFERCDTIFHIQYITFNLIKLLVELSTVCGSFAWIKYDILEWIYSVLPYCTYVVAMLVFPLQYSYNIC